jgi:hypothetical protein
MDGTCLLRPDYKSKYPPFIRFNRPRLQIQSKTPFRLACQSGHWQSNTDGAAAGGDGDDEWIADRLQTGCRVNLIISGISAGNLTGMNNQYENI